MQSQVGRIEITYENSKLVALDKGREGTCL